jgi:hypothetical protein
MRNWRTWKAKAKARSDLARRAAEARWAAYHEAQADDPIRQTRVVEMTIKDSHRPMRVIRMEAEQTERGWSRWLATENGERVGRRRFGGTAIAKLIERSVR